MQLRFQILPQFFVSDILLILRLKLVLDPDGIALLNEICEFDLFLVGELSVRLFLQQIRHLTVYAVEASHVFCQLLRQAFIDGRFCLILHSL